jgi:alpha-ketoglutarate-dependent taurine dioxygenase
MNASTIAVDPPTSERPLTLVAGNGGSPLDVSADTVEQLFKAHGAILLRGFSADVATFRTFAERFCVTSVFNESPGREEIDSESQIQTVNLGSDVFPLHPELSREPWRPDACLFFCLVPPENGGETTVCDGITIVERMFAVRTGGSSAALPGLCFTNRCSTIA